MEAAKHNNELRIETQKTAAAPPLSPGALAQEFGARLLDATACRAYLVAALHPNGPACPACAMPVPESQRARFLAWRRVACPCGRTYGPTTGTILARSNLDPRQIVALLLGLGLGLDASTTARLVGVSYETVRAWRAKLREASPHVEKVEAPA